MRARGKLDKRELAGYIERECARARHLEMITGTTSMYKTCFYCPKSSRIISTPLPSPKQFTTTRARGLTRSCNPEVSPAIRSKRLQIARKVGANHPSVANRSVPNLESIIIWTTVPSSQKQQNHNDRKQTSCACSLVLAGQQSLPRFLDQLPSLAKHQVGILVALREDHLLGDNTLSHGSERQRRQNCKREGLRCRGCRPRRSR